MSSAPYSPRDIEPKWQAIWEEKGVFRARLDRSRPKYYCLIEFPYPSGAGLHVGHPRSNTALDVIARKRRMEGYSVLYPIGWDAFGLPTENYAIANHVPPAAVTKQNVDRFRAQLRRLGFSFDYSREVNTTDPSYYKWTQWIFLKLFEHGLAYKAEMPINWCPRCRIGLANEEVVGGACERCGHEVTRRVKNQWMLAITRYAQKLLDGLEDVDFIERVKAQQRNWIGRSEGAEADFRIKGTDEKIRVFTTRADTMFGATYMVLSPEHPLLTRLSGMIQNPGEVAAYREKAARKSDFERTEMQKEKTGVEVKGVAALNPVSGAEMPVWVSDYVLMGYGTGAIMAVPGHDTRDWEFARAFGLPIVEVVSGGNVGEAAHTDIDEGVLVNSGFIDGMGVKEAQEAVVRWLEERGLGKRAVNYKLRDWVFSRQRYWGEPIPIVHCPACGAVPLPEGELPLLLPEVEKYEPTDSGESPLAAMEDWVKTSCPKCGGEARRETDTMPQWAGSSWYFLRYCDPHNDEAFASQEALDYWMPVDWYNGGMEHTTLHLLYSRFWHLFLHDIGQVRAPEPYQKRTSHGMILGENGEKMSKSRGNVVNPDDLVDELGADAFRMYEMFMGAFDQAIPWSTNGARGCRRFLDRVWRLMDIVKGGDGFSPALRVLANQTVKKVGEDYERMKFNTAIAQMMTLVNAYWDQGSVTRGDLRALLLLLSPVAPHVCEEMWQELGFGGYVHAQPWPSFDEAYLSEDLVEVAVQINGKVRARIMVPADMDKATGERELPGHPEVKALTGGRALAKCVFVPGRLLNLVLGA
ncbi:MAG TPA: leucine--tRNA ligase [Candidatus Limnocylindria bacterium]|nr:leucine--tRNA ligase [Candidatus Limnocylindria bacterium]